MRIQFSDTSRPKQAAKNLARFPGAPALSAVQTALAQSLGYRDWHDLKQNPGADTAISPRGPEAPRVIGNLADLTGLPDADVQYAISKARLFGSTAWTVDEQLDIRARLWRTRLFGPPGRGKPGTVVRDMAYNARTPAYLLLPGKPTTILSDTQRSGRADFEALRPGRRCPISFLHGSGCPMALGLWRTDPRFCSLATTTHFGGLTESWSNGSTRGCGLRARFMRCTSHRREAVSGLAVRRERLRSRSWPTTG